MNASEAGFAGVPMALCSYSCRRTQSYTIISETEMEGMNE